MEFFNQAKAVRLKSHHDKYLVADEDEETVRQSRNGSSRRARWTVEFVQGNNHQIRLKSCYGKYLTASENPFLLGMAGKRVVQDMPVSVQDCSIDWEPRTEGFRVKLKTRGGKFLRANGSMPPWRNSVTHDIPHRTVTQDWVLWEVDMMDIIESDLQLQDYISPASSFPSSVGSQLSSSQRSDVGCQLVSSLASNTHSLARESAMELFEKAKSVRLRSHHDKYLLADDDEETVSQERNGTIRNAKWTVEIVANSNAIRLKSCFGKYLTASNLPLLLGMRGKKVLQTLPAGRLDSSVEWEPIREGIRVRLRTCYGQYLRANGGVPPWRNHITHDIPHRSSTQDWILWDVDVVEIRVQDLTPPPPPRQRRHSDQIETAPNYEPSSPTCISTTPPKLTRQESDDSLEGLLVKNDGRVIHYSMSVNEDADDVEEHSFLFKGRMVGELKNKLEEETGLIDIQICSRNPLNGKFYPLRLHLPPNNTEMHVVVIPSSGRG
ncbi:PREDICTED: uncharacterized protein LOC105117238 isoform X1 [Populus euphratica]|uniref:Uncharacterized protein LOC105117238 isoform X1 n=2 Tax=Populus euphratica TaxID=75702 RepID=A0AAJ6XC49_POPEU|nr:PREDICTED: uncharacterized protein LOC105117238 isoform X1 [Populus euphratica]